MTPDFNPDSDPPVMQYDWELVGLDGAAYDLEQYRGRYLFLNTWATWCPPCIEEMPSIEALRQEFEPKGVHFLAVSVDEDPADVREFVARHDLGITVAMAAGRPPEPVTLRGVPRSYVIDPDGRVVLQWLGSTDWNSAESRKFFSSLLGEK